MESSKQDESLKRDSCSVIEESPAKRSCPQFVEPPEDQLVEILSELQDTPGTFATHGVIKRSPFPGLHIEGVGSISLPLSEISAKAIIEVSKKSPFGLGEETKLDDSVRKCWEVLPSQISIRNPTFTEVLDNVVCNVKSKLGCGYNHIQANLYKLLLYEAGGHFKSHVDSEKEDGMFATLVVQLPSFFKGNHLVVTHRGKSKTIDFDNPKSQFEMIYAAHYADCPHEVTPLESGYRICLVYNLVWTAPSDPPSVDQQERTIKLIASLLSQLEGRIKNVFGLTLDHKYTESSLKNGASALKGKDRTLAVLLMKAKKLLECNKFEFYIAKVARETVESGDHEYLGRYEGYGEFEPCDVEEDSTTIERAYDFKGVACNLERLSFDIEENLLDFESKYGSDIDEFWGEFDNEDVEGPTGNEGSSRTRWYYNYIFLGVREAKES